MLFHHEGAVTTSYDGEKSTLEWKFNRGRISVAQAGSRALDCRAECGVFVYFHSFPLDLSYIYYNFTLGNSNPR